jgi:hypothetical protein
VSVPRPSCPLRRAYPGRSRRSRKGVTGLASRTASSRTKWLATLRHGDHPELDGLPHPGAVSSLEGTKDRFWLSRGLFALSYGCYHSGDFDAALEARGAPPRPRRGHQQPPSPGQRGDDGRSQLRHSRRRGSWNQGMRACPRALAPSRPRSFSQPARVAQMAAPRSPEPPASRPMRPLLSGECAVLQPAQEPYHGP